MSVLYTYLTAYIIIKLSYNNCKIIFNKKFLLVYIITALFLLFPYRHLRSDLYEPFYWFLLSLSLYLLNKGKLFAFSIVWSVGIFTQVWNWIFSPFITLYLYKKCGFKKAMLYTFVYLSLGIISLSIFILPDINNYYKHVFGFYRDLINKKHYAETSIYITPLIHFLGLTQVLLHIQLFFSAIIGIISIFKLKTFRHLLIFLSFIFFTFIQFNSLTWNYMYINLLILLIIFFSLYEIDQSNK